MINETNTINYYQEGSLTQTIDYLYDVITRAVTYGGSNNVMKSNMFGLNLKVDLGKCFYRSTFRSLYSYI